MRTAMTLLALSLTLTGVAACKKKKPAEGGGTASGSTMTGEGTMAGSGSSTAGSDTMAGSGSSMAGSDTMAGSGEGTMAGSGSNSDLESMSKKAGNCPSTVFGSTTKAELKGKDIILTVTSDDKDAIATIQRRTEELLKDRQDGAGSGMGATHDQKGTYGGGKGLCPVYWEEGGKATSKKDAKGVVITITPKDKADELKKVIDERITKAAEFVKTTVKAGDAGTGGGVGGGKGDHGGNHSGSGDGKGKERKDGTGGGAGTGGGGGKGTGGGSGSGSAK